MGIIILLLVGMAVGWLASVVVGTGGGFLFDMVVGVLGALIASWLFGSGASFLTGAISLASVLYSVLGAVLLLLVVRLVRGGTWYSSRRGRW